MSEVQEFGSDGQSPDIDFFNSPFSPEEKKRLIQYLIEENRHSYKYSKKLSRRVSALKKLQRDHALLNSKFYQDLVEIERKYENEFMEIYEIRRQIVTGEREPTDDESHCSFPVGKYANWHVDHRLLMETPDRPGVPSFWKFVLLGVPFIRDMCRRDDQLILDYLTNVSCELMRPPGFTLKFYFAPNPYFTNSVLTRDCLFRIQPDPEKPFEFEGAEILEINGCVINWKPGKNITLNQTEMNSEKISLRPSFFNFFDPTVSKRNHFSASCIASYFRERIIPKAVLFFTGEAFIIDDDTPSFETQSTNDDQSSKSRD